MPAHRNPSPRYGPQGAPGIASNPRPAPSEDGHGPPGALAPSGRRHGPRAAMAPRPRRPASPDEVAAGGPPADTAHRAVRRPRRFPGRDAEQAYAWCVARRAVRRGARVGAYACSRSIPDRSSILLGIGRVRRKGFVGPQSRWKSPNPPRESPGDAQTVTRRAPVPAGRGCLLAGAAGSAYFAARGASAGGPSPPLARERRRAGRGRSSLGV